MVKFKSRYFLVETLYENGRCQPFDTAKIALTLKQNTENLFGDVGVGKLHKNLQVKYMNNVTNLLIIRVGKENYKLIWSIIGLINNIDGIKMRMRILGLSGTIKKCEKKAKKLLEKWMSNYEKLKKIKSILKKIN